MIDVWILTVVTRNSAGVTSFQLKFYSEDEADYAGKQYSDSLIDSFSLFVSVTKTKEQKINA